MRALILTVPVLLAACGEPRVNPPTQPAAPVEPDAAVAPPAEPGDLSQALPGTGPASFVGRWAANVSWCASPRGDARPIEITPTQFLGYENTCQIAAVDELPNGYELTLACVAEGVARTERVRASVNGQSMVLTYLDRDGASATLTRCTTLDEVSPVAGR